MTRLSRISAGIALLTAAGLACNLPLFTPSTPPAAATLGQLYTAAALTLAAGTPQPPTATPTSPGAFPTFPPIIATRTAGSVTACDAAAFVRDVTIPDGTTIDPGDDFTKTWRVANAGTCTWTPSYALVFVSGDRMQGPVSISMPRNVSPGETVDLGVNLTAPTSNGEYQGYWKLRNAAGNLFGIGLEARGAFWVKIRVAGPTHTAYDFARRYCEATWGNGNRELPCPGDEGDAKGYVIELEDAVMENGNSTDEAALLTVPRSANDGIIYGQFPAIKVRAGDHFQARVNCAYRANSCNVIFSLSYQIGNGSIKTLGRWNEAYEGKYFPVDVDLSSLAGSNVKFILSVSANGSFDKDRAMWIAPRITRLGVATSTATPTATATSTPTATPTPTRPSFATQVAPQIPTLTATAVP